MGTFGNLRPCFFASDSLVSSSPLKEEVCRGVDFTIVRELTGGIYFGDRKEDDGSGDAYDVETYSRPEIERITRLAASLALVENPPLPVMSLDKGERARYEPAMAESSDRGDGQGIPPAEAITSAD